jgi:hypothetical protein
VAKFKNDIVKSLTGIYSGFFDLAILISSLFFSFWIILGIIFKVNYDNIFLFTCLSIIVLNPKHPEKMPRYYKATSIIKRIAITLGSIIVFCLFLNSYFKISPVINQQFLEFIADLEPFLNSILFSLICLFILIMFYFGFLYYFLLFLFKIIKINSDTIKAIIILVIFLLTFGLFYFLLSRVDSFTTIMGLFYGKLNWILGISLISLHLGYIFKNLLSKTKELLN